MGMERKERSGTTRVFCTFRYIDMMEESSTLRVISVHWIWSVLTREKEGELQLGSAL